MKESAHEIINKDCSEIKSYIGQKTNISNWTENKKKIQMTEDVALMEVDISG